MGGTEHRISVNGVALFTRRVGDGPPTIVLHGGPGAHHDYLLPQYDRLATRRSLQYYDQRGGGRSPTGRDVALGWEAHVADLDALRRQWGITAATLLGYSLGGLLAMLYAVRHPDAVSRLALVCPAPARVADRRRFEAAFAERSRAPAIVAAREALQRSDLRTTDPEAYRRRLFELSVAGYFHDPERVRDLTPFRVTGRTQQAVWESLGGYDLTRTSKGSASRRWCSRAGTIPSRQGTVTVEVLSPARPRLDIKRSGATGNVDLSWPAPASNFVLEYIPDLTPTNLWLPAAGTRRQQDQNIVVTESADGGARLFRLRQP